MDRDELIDPFVHDAMWSAVRAEAPKYEDPQVEISNLGNLELDIYITKDASIVRIKIIDLVKVALKLITIPGMPYDLAKRNLARYGFAITKKGFLFIATNNDSLEQLLKEKLNIINLKIYLHNLPHISIAKHSRTLHGQSSRGVLLDLGLICS